MENKIEQQLSKIDLPSDFDLLEPELQKVLIQWIRNNLEARKTVNKIIGTSYSLKHIFEKQTGIYVTNGQFKGAMLACGLIPEPGYESKLNWYFRIKFISKK